MTTLLKRLCSRACALIVCAGLLTVFCLYSLPCMAQNTAGLDLILLHTNDLHSYIAGRDSHGNACFKSEGCTGGLARLATAMKRTRAEHDNVLAVDAGDQFQGTLFFTANKWPMLADINALLPYDAMTLGNHEFDDGDATLKGFLDELAKGSCNTSVISSNVVPAAGAALAPTVGSAYLKPWVIKEIDGVKVGLIGITIAGKTVNSSRPLATTAFNEEVAAAQKAIDELKAQHTMLNEENQKLRDERKQWSERLQSLLGKLEQIEA